MTETPEAFLLEYGDEEEIEPALKSFVSAVLSSAAPAGTDPATQRRAAERGRATWARGGPSMQRVLDLKVEPANSSIRIRLFEPAGDHSSPHPVFVYLHGGGFTLFSLDTHDRLMREYAARSGLVVVGVDYSLAPEARFPTALHEIVAVVDWLRVQAGELEIDPRAIGIGGDSAGANLALACCLLLRDRGERRAIKAMLLNYGFFDADFDTPSQRRYGGSGEFLTSEELACYLQNYLANEADWRDPLALPALAELHDLPPSFHVIAGRDPLADGDRRLAARLNAAGSPAEVHIYPGATHSFLEAMSISRLADIALTDSADWLRRALAGPSTNPDRNAG